MGASSYSSENQDAHFKCAYFAILVVLFTCSNLDLHTALLLGICQEAHEDQRYNKSTNCESFGGGNCRRVNNTCV
jgi:hypothetical protein